MRAHGVRCDGSEREDGDDSLMARLEVCGVRA